MQAALHDAVKTHGCPSYLYCDNGSAYSSGQLAWSAAVLDIQITHSRPGRPQGRGKIERWNRTCRDQFLVEIEVANTGGGSTCSSLADLNRLFTAWLHQRYHRAQHSETGQPPAQRYHHSAAAPPRPRPAPAGVPVARAAHRLDGRDRGPARQPLRGRRQTDRPQGRPAVAG